MSASPSPSPERIELCTPPDSPNWESCFQFSAPDTLDPLETTRTPLKAPKGVQPRRGVKRRRPDSDLVEAPPNALPVCDDSSTTISNGDVFGEYSTGPVGTFDPSLAVVSDDGGLAGNRVDSYEHYVDAALADCCGFFQISKTLFVVQGWDAKGQRSTVSRIFFFHKTSLHRPLTGTIIIFRLCGIICSVFVLGMNYVSPAPAHNQAGVCTNTFCRNIRKISSRKTENSMQAVWAQKLIEHCSVFLTF
jgi:hypothetical protein